MWTNYRKAGVFFVVFTSDDYWGGRGKEFLSNLRNYSVLSRLNHPIVLVNFRDIYSLVLPKLSQVESTVLSQTY